jgi:hypothetical protein
MPAESAACAAAALPPVVPAAVASTAGVERVDAVRVDVPATLLE